MNVQAILSSPIPPQLRALHFGKFLIQLIDQCNWGFNRAPQKIRQCILGSIQLALCPDDLQFLREGA